jgi:hypothetical protein
MAFQLCNIMSFQAVHHDLNTPNDPQDIEMTSSEEDVVDVHDTYGTHNSDHDSDDSAPCHTPSHLYFNSDNVVLSQVSHMNLSLTFCVN